MDRLAEELKASHERWMERMPSNEALEIALKDLTNMLPADSTTEEDSGLTLDGATQISCLACFAVSHGLFRTCGQARRESMRARMLSILASSERSPAA